MTMLNYAYKGRDGGGKIVKGKLDAPSEAAAVARLKTMGVMPTELAQSAAGTGLQMEINIGFLEKKVGLKDLAVMSRQMATMVSSGLSLLRTLTILADQTENKKLGTTLDAVRVQVETGASLSAAFGKFPQVFPPLMVHLIRAGETGGFLDRSLESVASTFEKEVKLTQTIKSALTYPIVVLCMAVVATIAMLVFIVPVFETMFAGLNAELPVPTQILVTLSKNMIWIVPLLIVIGIVFALWWRSHKHDEKVRQKVDSLKLKLPVFGLLFKKVAVARFARNFSTMTKSGVPILQALSIVGETSGSWVIANAMQRVQDSVRSGRSVSAPLAEEPVFPQMVVQMIAVGEDAGALDTMLGKVADFYDEEVQTTTESLTSLIEPLMIAVIGVIVGGMIVALYLPMFSVFSAITNQSN
ncbi:type II secretion system F family protein [Protaetiibacter larvae]|uniref:Type II secretion system F family protein n=1 Tax=Protaetiibacter larvae TaxID=2592654 RepID=A0A5C1Y5A6_9MICO|nr:type II secretion system F family protein [Protaetiibacter larvae]QEO09223.1 type II secretion system F family protein [Protaetiibacter larvae]